MPFSALLFVAASCVSGSSRQEGVITFDTLSIERIEPLIDSVPDPHLTLSIMLERPVNGADESQLDAAKALVVNLVEDAEYFAESGSDLDHMVQLFIDRHIQGYKAEGSEIAANYQDNPQAAIAWSTYQLQLQGTCLYNDNGLLSYKVQSYRYTGGAHGETMISCGVMNLLTSNPIHLANIFDEESLLAVAGKIEQHLVTMFEGENLADLRRKGIIFEDAEVGPTENFALTDQGITWVWNECDIAPYVIGSIAVHVPWTELRELLPASSEVLPLVQTLFPDSASVAQ